MWLVSGDYPRVREKMAEMLHRARQQGLKTGVLAVEEHVKDWKTHPDADVVLSVGASGRLEEAAKRLYAALRRFDDLQVQFIVSETFPRKGMGMAVMNRLEKAAGGRIVSV